MATEAVQDYLKAIYSLQEEQARATTSALAERLAVSPASVTGMMKKLSEMRPKLVEYAPRHGVRLTPAGGRIALETIRHHRLLELYLHATLGYPWDQVDAEAEKLEHVISEEFEDRIAAALGQPRVDPHGDPIPDKRGRMAASTGARLTDLRAGQSGRVQRVRDDDPAVLRYLGGLGIVPEARVAVVQKAPFDGPLHVLVNDHRESDALGRQVTDQVFVDRIE